MVTQRAGVVYLDGRFVDRASAAVSVDDRGFLFGDGVYEVTRALDGRLFESERHVRRLARGLRELALTLPLDVDARALGEISLRLLRENQLTRGSATVYLQVTRGAAPRTHHFPPADTRATVYVSASPLPVPDAVRERGASAILVDDLRWQRCDIKTIQLLPNVLAKQRAAEGGVYEAVMVRDGIITEGSSTNVFVVVDDVLCTHPATHRILPGVTRDVVLELARAARLRVAEREVRVEELRVASELFITSTTNDVMPVVLVDGERLGSGAPGPIARRLHEMLVSRMRAQCAHVTEMAR